VKRFFYGAGLVFEGISFFYRERKLWKYVAGPVFILIVTYALSIWGILLLSQKLARYSEAHVAGWPEFLRNLISGSLFVTALILCAIVIVTTVSALFEIFGGLFFDRMVEEINRKYYNIDSVAVPLKKQLLFTCQGCWYGVKTALIFAILFITGIFLPFWGQLLLIVFTGIRLGYSFLFVPGFIRGEGIAETSALFKNKKLEVAGFGICAYLCQLLPFAVLFTLPGMVAGALMLYNGREPQR
jgi:CysZ protein